MFAYYIFFLPFTFDIIITKGIVLTHRVQLDHVYNFCQLLTALFRPFMFNKVIDKTVSDDRMQTAIFVSHLFTVLNFSIFFFCTSLGIISVIISFRIGISFCFSGLGSNPGPPAHQPSQGSGALSCSHFYLTSEWLHSVKKRHSSTQPVRHPAFRLLPLHGRFKCFL